MCHDGKYKHRLHSVFIILLLCFPFHMFLGPPSRHITVRSARHIAIKVVKVKPFSIIKLQDRYVVQFLKALRYKPEVRCSIPRCGHKGCLSI